RRPHAYGGSAGVRFPLELVKAVAAAVGESRTSVLGVLFLVRMLYYLSHPVLTFYFLSLGMGMADPVPTRSQIVSELKRLHPTLAHIHVIQPRISADSSVDASPQNAGQSNDFLRDIWGDRPLISGGGFTAKLTSCVRRHLIANVRQALSCVKRLLTQRFCVQPYLSLRLQKNIPLHPYDRPTFYLPGQDAPTGYTGQPFCESCDSGGVKGLGSSS
ncbi:hypothetical protein B0H14DRAFT_2405177, partial [Mycena olivaceomarginata]